MKAACSVIFCLPLDLSIFCHCRLDKRKNPYDLIWEDDVILAGKVQKIERFLLPDFSLTNDMTQFFLLCQSFYLPGSINVYNQQMDQWNIVSPPLYLWSRPDWTAKHKAVAMQQGHIRKSEAEGNIVHTGITNYLMQETHDCYGDFSDILTSCGDISSLLDDIPEISIDAECNQNQHFGVPEQDMCYEGKDENETSPAEDMCIDMDLSTPTNSPLH